VLGASFAPIVGVFTAESICAKRSKRDLAPAFRKFSSVQQKTLDLLTKTAKERTITADDEEIYPGIDVAWAGGHSPCSQIHLRCTRRASRRRYFSHTSCRSVVSAVQRAFWCPLSQRHQHLPKDVV